MRILENRIPPPLVAAIFAAAMWIASLYAPAHEVSEAVRIGLAFSALAAGLFVCLSGVVSFRRAKTTVNPLKPEKASSLVVSGVYRYSRNPMYLGFSLILIALAIYLYTPIALIGVVCFVMYINRFQIAPEERALESLFGAEFTAYKRRVRRWG